MRMESSAFILTLPSSRERRGAALRLRMRPWAITITDLAMHLAVSRQYVWQILYGKTAVSDARYAELDRAIDELVSARRVGRTFGERLRGARIAAGLTLREAAGKIGYSWIAVERWEQDSCLPKPGVLWHLRHVYGVGEDWMPRDDTQRPVTSADNLR